MTTVIAVEIWLPKYSCSNDRGSVFRYNGIGEALKQGIVKCWSAAQLFVDEIGTGLLSTEFSRYL